MKIVGKNPSLKEYGAKPKLTATTIRKIYAACQSIKNYGIEKFLSCGNDKRVVKCGIDYLTIEKSEGKVCKVFFNYNGHIRVHVVNFDFSE